jgi:hypothetical protein
MVVVPLATATNGSSAAVRSRNSHSAPWLRIAAAGTLATSGALLATGRRRAGLVTAISGTILAMIDQQESVCAWWNALPGQLDEIQQLIGRAQSAVDDLTAQGQKLHQALGR